MASVLAFPPEIAQVRVSVVMVSYMTGPALFEAIAAVLEDPDICELIIVDNGNEIETRRKLGLFAARNNTIQIIQGQGNIGFSKANNLGAKVATGDYLLFLNPDAILRKGTLRKLVKCGSQLKGPWIAGAMLRLTNGLEQCGARRELLTPWSAFVSFTPLHKLPFFETIHRHNDPVPTEPISIPVVSGACMLMKRTGFDSIGGFDEAYFLHVEDIDICRRVGEAGGKIYFVPDAEVTHYGSTSRVRRQSVEWQKADGLVTYFRKYAKTSLGRFYVTLATPFIFLTIMSRAWWLVFRKAIMGH
ncbi:MAG: glycosyltransferase family 2 protein [Maricaulaceae bacterium]